MTTPEEGLMDVTDVAAYLKISPAHVYRLTAEHRMPFTRLGVAKRFRRKDIDAWLDSKTRMAVK